MSKVPPASPISKRDVDAGNKTHSGTTAAGRPLLQRHIASDASLQSNLHLADAPCGLTSSEHDAQETRPGESAIEREGDLLHTQNDAAEATAHIPAAMAQGNVSPDEIEIDRLRKLQLKVLQQQQRMRSMAVSASATGRRFSPIKEEPTSSALISPTLAEAFHSLSPLPTTLTISTESTESVRTVRASMPHTPAAGLHPLGTPSYPFPIVPSPRWSSAFHMPFTTLSPTVSANQAKESTRSIHRSALESSTPAAPTTFAPGNWSQSGPEGEDPRFPSPNLYDLVLRLGAEPGLAAWWTVVTSIMCDCYGATRATLAVPADASDIENVPWGQKASFTATMDTHASRAAVYEEGEVWQNPKKSYEALQSQQHTEPQDVPLTSSESTGRRPKLFSHHSFAGHERQKQSQASDNIAQVTSVRPRLPTRALSHAPHMNVKEHPLRQVVQASVDGPHISLSSATPSREVSFSDVEFSSVGGEPTLSLAVFHTLRALDHEPDALIDNSGINRVLERGRLVTLTRDYSTGFSTSKEELEEQGKPEALRPAIPGLENIKGTVGRGIKVPSLGGASQPHYEEYEQLPTSPWAQSPAPSPAIQNDADTNPFFMTARIDEDTFNPSRSPPDYTQIELVEAIGVDKASTITHIPFIHPTLSQAMNSTDMSPLPQTPSLSSKQSEQELPSTPTSDGFTRKAPIAILSILSPIAPYPRNLTNSLKQLAPHLATTFSNAWQFTNTQAQVVSVRQRRLKTTTPGGLSFTSDKESLDDLLRLNLEDITPSIAGSVTSPSDYSSRSRHSPGGSIAGTPAWETPSRGISSKHLVGSTPGHLAGSDSVESYFDSKRKSGRPLAIPSPAATDNPLKKADPKVMKRVSMSSVTEESGDDAVTSRTEQTFKDESPLLNKTASTVAAGRVRSFLHSYGADFSSSFQSLPATTMPSGRPTVKSEYVRRNSITETLDMPPPSESLLRTITDSLPVQIFTAAPNSGAITWVNSKFLIYRGQDCRQVLESPWDAIHPEDRDAYLSDWNNSLRTGQQLQKKVRLQRFDNCYRWFYVRVAPLKNKRQQIVHWIGTNMDFHEQHLAEMNSARQQETAASEAKYRALANSSPQIVFVVSDRRGLTFCNSQWTTFSGQAEIQALGSGFLEHVHPDDVIKCKLPGPDEYGVAKIPTSLSTEDIRHDSSSSDASSETGETLTSLGAPSPDRLDPPQAKLSNLASTGLLKVIKDADGRSSYSTEVRLRNKDGDFRWHLVRILLEKSLADDGEAETWYGTATDINDHKLLEQTLKETMDAKSKFLSNMSHEIRTPLNGISGMVNFLLDSTLNNEQLEHVNIIKASTDSLLNLINDILDLSKVEAGMIKLSMDWLHLPSLIEEVNDLNMGLAIQKGLELNYLIEEGVPSMVKGDKFRIRQVLLNVVGNAIKFTSKGEIFVRCKLQSSDRSDHLKDNEAMIRFEVVDTGAGFTEAEAKYLFKRFSQIDASSTRQHGGTGLGLAISMQFVELHGGCMDAKSIPNKGSTFFFTIKFGLPSQEDAPVPRALTPVTPAFDPAHVMPLISPQTPQPSPLQKFIQAQTPSSMPLKRVSSVTSERNEPLKSPTPSLSASEKSRESSSVSSAGSEMSLTSSVLTGKSSLKSVRSSASSFLQEASLPLDRNINLALPQNRFDHDAKTPSDDSSTSLRSEQTARPISPNRSLSPLGSAMQPPMFSILVVCPLLHSREATIRHIKNTLPEGIPHHITGESSILGAHRMIGGDSPVLFTHVVLVLHDTAEVHALMDQIYSSLLHGNTSIVVVSDPSQKKELIKEAPSYDYDQLHVDRKLHFVYRPLKPSKFAFIFDPRKEREMSTDRNQDSAQQVVVNQKIVFDELKRRVGGKGHKVLLVEDNKINQTVILKFLARIDIETETVFDGVQCNDTVFSKPPGYYSIILCDLHMPNKDGYQACKEIRQWEKQHRYRAHPIIALSANVLGDVHDKCVEAGFNSYVTKPVEFKALSLEMTKFLDLTDPSKPPEPMKRK